MGVKTNLETKTELKVQTRLKLTPQLRTQIKILEMPITELEEKVKELAEENPLIEVVSQDDIQKPDSKDSGEEIGNAMEGIGETKGEIGETREEIGTEGKGEKEHESDIEEEGGIYGEESIYGEEFGMSDNSIQIEGDEYSPELLYSDDFYHSPSQNNPDLDEMIRQEQENIPSYIVLWEKVLPQIEEAFRDEKERKVAEKIFFSLDEKGFFSADVNDVISELSDEGVSISHEEFEEIRRRFMELEPEGIGAKNIKEYLIFILSKRIRDRNELKQIEEKIDRLFQELVKSEGEETDFLSGNPTAVEIIREIREKINSFGIRDIPLYPIQEFRFLQEEFHEVRKPDVYVFKDMGKLYVIPAKDTIHVRIPRWVKKVQRHAKGENERKKFKEMLSVAQMYYQGIRKRKEILIKVVKAIFTYQDSFLETGVKKPMTLQDVERLCGYDKSTIWRAVSNKYVETPYGVFKLKDFFDYGLKVRVKKSSGAEGETSEEGGEEEERMISRTEVLEEIKKLVENEDPENPLSDSQIAKILREKRGIQIARRTVVKYRKRLGIPSIEERRRKKGNKNNEVK